MDAAISPLDADRARLQQKATDEEWGKTQLVEAIRPNLTLHARELIHGIMQEADAFVAGAPQHDDMTLVVIRLI